MSRKICLVQLRSAPERRCAGEMCLFRKPKQPQNRGEIGKGRDLRIVHVISRLGPMLIRVVETQDRLELRPSFGKIPEMHSCDPRKAMSGEPNDRVREPSRYLLSLVGQPAHHRIIVADKVIHELAAERSDERFYLAESFAEGACSGVRGARLRSGVPVDGN